MPGDTQTEVRCSNCEVVIESDKAQTCADCGKTGLCYGCWLPAVNHGCTKGMQAMLIYVTIKNDDDRESAVIGVTNKWQPADGSAFTEQEVRLKGGESRRFVVQPDDVLQLQVHEVHEPVPCWC